MCRYFTSSENEGWNSSCYNLAKKWSLHNSNNIWQTEFHSKMRRSPIAMRLSDRTNWIVLFLAHFIRSIISGVACGTSVNLIFMPIYVTCQTPEYFCNRTFVIGLVAFRFFDAYSQVRMSFVSSIHSARISILYQLAFLTPGKSPDSAFILKLYCNRRNMISIIRTLYPLQHPSYPGVIINKIHTLDILKSLRIPLPLPPKIHLFLICVGLV